MPNEVGGGKGQELKEGEGRGLKLLKCLLMCISILPAHSLLLSEGVIMHSIPLQLLFFLIL